MQRGIQLFHKLGDVVRVKMIEMPEQRLGRRRLFQLFPAADFLAELRFARAAGSVFR